MERKEHVPKAKGRATGSLGRTKPHTKKKKTVVVRLPAGMPAMSIGDPRLERLTRKIIQAISEASRAQIERPSSTGARKRAREEIPMSTPTSESSIAVLPATAYIAIEFPDDRTARSFLQMCLDQRPSIRVTLVGPRAITVPRDQLALLESILEKHPPEKVTAVHPLSEHTPEEAARIRGWRVPKDVPSKKAILDSYDAMLAKLKKLARTDD